MNDAERERLYREALAARRAGDVCPLCGYMHGALTACVHPDEGLPIPAQSVPPSARNTDPETSHEAATPTPKKERLRYICLALYAEHPEGLMDDDLARLAGHPEGHESYRRRGSDLRSSRLRWTEYLYAHGEDGVRYPVRRRTAIGGTARVSVITEKGRSVLEARRG